MPENGFGDLVTHCSYRVERVHRPLEDNRNAAPADLIQFLFAQRCQVLSFEEHMSIHDLPGSWQQSQQ